VIAPRLHQDINDIAILIDRTPEVVPLPLNGDKDFINMPGVTQPPLAFLEVAGVVRSKLLAPLAHGFVGHRDSPFSQEFFQFTEAQTESMIQPAGVTNNFSGKTVTWVAGFRSFHVAQSATSELN